MKRRRPASKEGKGLQSVGKRRITQRPEQERQKSQRSALADHVRGPRVEEHWRDGHCDLDAVTRKVGGGHAARAWTRSRLVQREAPGGEAEGKVPRRR